MAPGVAAVPLAVARPRLDAPSGAAAPPAAPVSLRGEGRTEAAAEVALERAAAECPALECGRGVLCAAARGVACTIELYTEVA